MGLENWIHRQIDKIAQNDKEFLIVFAGIAGMALIFGSAL